MPAPIRTTSTSDAARAVRRRAILLTQLEGEPRVDSRVLAAHLRNHHKNLMELIDRYRDMMARFGVVPFETEKPAGPLGGRPERYALLNEDQSYFLLSLSRNSDHIVELKANLVETFSKLRRAGNPDEEYLPSYHELHRRVQTLAVNSSNVQFVHMNFNKLINKTVGIKPGHRASLESASRSLVCVAQAFATKAMEAANDHHDGYQVAKLAMKQIEPIAKQLTGASPPKLG